MEEALELGRRGLGRTWPNPPVGAVVLAGGAVVGRGFHARAGEAHAEVVALRQAGGRARGATVVVTLEPCCHQGRTPPCTEALLEAGVARVAFGAGDPDPRVAGGGARRLREAGVEVIEGVGAGPARELLAGFASRVLRGRPEVLLKAACTLDGQLAPAGGVSRWITGAPARRRVHQLRDQSDAVLVGAGTVRVDDPGLTVRDPAPADGHQPLRVVLDSRGRTPAAARCLGPGSIVLTTAAAAEPWRRELTTAGVELAVLGAGPGGVDLVAALTWLGARGLTRILVEGGGRLLGSLLRGRLGDRVALFYGPLLVGAGGHGLAGDFLAQGLAEAVRLEETRMLRLGDDWMIEGRLAYPDQEA